MLVWAFVVDSPLVEVLLPVEEFPLVEVFPLVVVFPPVEVSL